MRSAGACAHPRGPESVLQSGFFRQFYEAAFNAPSELSAAVALESIYKIFSKRWHYYFNSPTTESIIAPLRRYFTDCCRGRIELDQKLTKVRTDEAGVRVLGLDFENLATGGGVRSGGRIRSCAWARRLQAGGLWRDRLPARLFPERTQVADGLELIHPSMVQGRPCSGGNRQHGHRHAEPFGILCPITRVRATHRRELHSGTRSSRPDPSGDTKTFRTLSSRQASSKGCATQASGSRRTRCTCMSSCGAIATHSTATC